MQFTRLLLAATTILASAMSAVAATMVWNGAATTPQWRLAGNWAGGVVPGPSDDAVFDSSSSKSCVIDQPMTVGSLIVKPGYGGKLSFRATFTVNGALTLRDTVAIQYNTHEYSHIKGSPVDLSGLKKCLGSYTEFALDLDAPAGTIQRFIPPTDTTVRITQLRSYGYRRQP